MSATAGDPWYATLTEAARQRVFGVMRELDAEATTFRRDAERLSPPHGSSAVGAGAFEPLARAIGIEGFLTGLRKGGDPAAAGETAKRRLLVAVQKHNSRRVDHNWQRHADHGADGIPHLIRRVNHALGGGR